jgi:hypothetical protein
MLSRRRFLLAGSAFGLPLTAVLPVPAGTAETVRLGLLQLREPFIDYADPAGSRARALEAFRSLLRRTLAEQGPLDWVATPAFPLTGPLAGAPIRNFALTADSEELRWLRRFTARHALRISLSAWYRDGGRSPAPALLVIEPDGSAAARPLQTGPWLVRSRRMMLETGVRAGGETALADRCRELGLYGAGIAACRGPAPPPGAPARQLGQTRFIAPTGRVRAQLPPGEEGCLAVAL